MIKFTLSFRFALEYQDSCFRPGGRHQASDDRKSITCYSSPLKTHLSPLTSHLLPSTPSGLGIMWGPHTIICSAVLQFCSYAVLLRSVTFHDDWSQFSYQYPGFGVYRHCDHARRGKQSASTTGELQQSAVIFQMSPYAILPLHSVIKLNSGIPPDLIYIPVRCTSVPFDKYLSTNILVLCTF